MSIRAVADAVGVTPPSIYLHFADKTELMVAVCALQWERFDSFVESALDGIDDPLTRLMERGRAYIRFGTEHPEHYRVLFMSKTAQRLPAPDQHVLSVSGFTHLLENVVDAQSRGSLDGSHDPLLVATALWSVVHGITSLAIAVPGFPLVGMDTLIDHLFGAYATGVAPTCSPASRLTR